MLLKSAVIRLPIIKLLLLNCYVRPPIKIPKLNTTFPIKVLLSKPVVTDSFRICKWPWIILRWPVQHFPSFNSVSLLVLPDMTRIPQQGLQLPRSWHSPFPKQPMKRQYHHRGVPPLILNRRVTGWYSQLSPCGHSAIKETPIIRTAAKSSPKIY